MKLCRRNAAVKEALLSWVRAGCSGEELVRDPFSGTTYSLLEYSKTTDTKLWDNMEVLTTSKAWVAFDRCVGEALQAFGVYQHEAPTKLETSSPGVSDEEHARVAPIGSSSSSANDRASSATEIKGAPVGRQTHKRRGASPSQPRRSTGPRIGQAPRQGSYQKVSATEAGRLQREGCDVAGKFLYRVSESRGSSDKGRTRTSWILTDANDRDLIDARFEVREISALKHRG